MIKKTVDILIDFDGTCVAHEFPKVGKDIGAVPVLQALAKRGHRLILFTMRSDCVENTGHSEEFPEVISGDFLTDAVNWFKENNIPLYGIQRNPDQDSWTTSPKAYGQLIIDDICLGIPLVKYPDHDGRPYVDWKRVNHWLQLNGYL